MSLRPYTKIQIEQLPNSEFPERNKTFIIDFVIAGEIQSSWENLTDKARFILPRNVYVEDQEGNLINWTEKSIYGNTSDESPLFMRGDKVTIDLGVFVDKMDSTEELDKDTAFVGYISRIGNRIPIEIFCEDEMWKVKQIRCPDKMFKESEFTLQQIMEFLLSGTEYTVMDGTQTGYKTTIGDFRTSSSETVGDILQRLKEAGIYSYTRNNVLRCSGVVYYPEDRREFVFQFAENIIDDRLEYQRAEDLFIAVQAHADIIVTEGETKDGKPKTKKKRVEVLVDKDGEVMSPNAYNGDVFSMPVYGAKTKADLLARAKRFLPKISYTGYRGTFRTFIAPLLRHGDGVILRNSLLPEREGTYLIKENIIQFGNEGHRQIPMLHIRIDKGYTQTDLNAGI